MTKNSTPEEGKKQKSVSFLNKILGGQVNQAGRDIHNTNNLEVDNIEKLIVKELIINFPSEDKNTSEVQGTADSSNLATTIGPNPYKGLQAFDENDRTSFFGRSTEIKILQEKIYSLYRQESNYRLLPVHGPSGSGKSSLVRAGLIPELRENSLPESEELQLKVLKPGTDPLQSLAKVLAFTVAGGDSSVRKTRELAEELLQPNKSGDYDGLQRIASHLPRIDFCPLIIVVDQFEETFSLCNDAELRNAFIANLLYAAKDLTKHVSVILTMRSDFMGELYQYPDLGRLFSKPGFLVPPMDKTALREVIVHPAQNAGYNFDEGTINLLINQTIGRTGALPLLQFSLTQIWDKLNKTEPVEPAKTLQELGGVGGAVAKKGEEIYAGLSELEQKIARRVFLKLVHLREGLEDTRQRTAIQDMIAAQDKPEQVIKVIRQFSSIHARLITVFTESNQGFAEISHEALISYWPLLKQWLDEGRQLLPQQLRIENLAKEWKKQDKKSSFLLQGKQVSDAIKFDKHHKDSFPLTEDAKDFLNKSILRRRTNRIGLLSLLWLLLPGVNIFLYEHQIYEYYQDVETSAEKRQPVASLTSGCYKLRNWPSFLLRIGERVIGNNCRSLENMNLSGGDFYRLNLYEVDLSGSDLSKTNFTEATLLGANLENVDLTGANLVGADLTRANLRRAELINLDISSAHLHKANLQTATLDGATLIGSDLRDADLRDTIIKKSNFKSAEMQNAVLMIADLAEVGDKNLSLEQMQTGLLCNTRLPENWMNLSNRDCDQLIKMWADQYPISEDEASMLIQNYKDKQWGK